MIEMLLKKDYRQRPSVDQILEMSSMREKMRMFDYKHTPSEVLKVKKAQPSQGQSASRSPAPIARGVT
jgi:hypothetical protein